MELVSKPNTDWVTNYYDDVDQGRVDELISRHTDGCVMRYANYPPAVGKADIAEAIRSGYPLLVSMKHHIRNVFRDGDTTIVEADLEYHMVDGREIWTPVASVFHRREGLIDHLRIYADTSAVFASA